MSYKCDCGVPVQEAGSLCEICIEKQAYIDEWFDAELCSTIDTMSGSELLAIEGIYEILSEELNNEVIESLEERWESERSE